MPKPKRMKAYATFSLWTADQSPKHRRLIGLLRKRVAEWSPRLTESVKWGNGVWIGKEWPVLYLFAAEDHLQFGFFGGSELSDPGKRLQGNGKHVRHLKVRKSSDIDEAAFKRWVRQAARIERAG